MAMITIKIKGQPVKVDEKFKTLSPADQQKTVNEIAAQMGLVSAPQRTEEPPAPPKPEEQSSGLIANIGAAIDTGANALLGAPVDIPVSIYNYFTQPQKPEQPRVKLKDVMSSLSGNKPTEIPSLIPGPREMLSAVQGFTSGFGLPAAPTDLPGSSAGWQQLQGSLGFQTPETVTAATPAEKFIRTVVPIGMSVAIPEAMVGRFAQLGMLPEEIAPILTSLFGKSTKPTELLKTGVVAGTAAAAGEKAAEYAPEPLKPTVAVLASIAAGVPTGLLVEAPGAMLRGTKRVGEYLDPALGALGNKSALDREAGREILRQAQNKDRVIESLKGEIAPLPSGMTPTLAQVTGDVGIAAAQKEAAARNADLFALRKAEVGAAQEKALRGLQPGGDVTDVIPAIHRYQDNLEALQNAIDEQAAKKARDLADEIHAGTLTPTDAGNQIRGMYDAKRSLVTKAEGALHDAIDPDGTLKTSIASVKRAVINLYKDFNDPLRGAPSSIEQDFISRIKTSPTVASFKGLQAISSDLAAAMRDPANAGSVYGRLSQIKAAVQNQLDNGAIYRMQQEAAKVQSGKMKPEDTLYAKLSRVSDELARQQIEAGGNAGARAAQAPGAYEATFGGANAPVGRGERGLGGLEGGEGLPPPAGRTPDELARQAVEAPPARPAGATFEPPTPEEMIVSGQTPPSYVIDKGAASRRKAAVAATTERVGTYDNPYLAEFRKKDPTGLNFSLAAEKIADSIFSQQRDANARVEALRKAIGKESADRAISGYVMNRMANEAVVNGVIDPKKIDAFIRSHNQALSVMPELKARLANKATLANDIALEAKAQAKDLKDRQLMEASGAINKFMSDKNIIASDPKAVKDAVKSVLTGTNAAENMRKLRRIIGGDKNALDGMHKAITEGIADDVVDQIQGPNGVTAVLNGQKLLDFLDTHKEALSASGLSKEQLTAAKNLGIEAATLNRLLAEAKPSKKPFSAGDVFKAIFQKQPASILNRITLRSLFTHGALALGTGFSPLFLAVDAALTVLRHKGLESVNDIVAEAINNPKMSQALVMKVTPKNQKIVTERLRNALTRRVRLGAAIGAIQAGEANP